MKVAIPSHHRSDTIGKQALAFALADLKTPASDVYVFVSDNEQIPGYVKAIGTTGVNIINANTTNVRDKFNFIHAYFKGGEDVLVVEDDVKGLITISDKTAKDIVAEGFTLMHKHDKCLWGVYPSSNKFFMKKIVRSGFSFIVANIYGFKADGDARTLIKEHSKTDYERSILYFIFKKGSIRLDYVAANTNNYTNKGGMQLLSNRATLEKTACENLMRRFPKLVAVKKNTKSKYAEIKFLK
jgi:hypothetical protein